MCFTSKCSAYYKSDHNLTVTKLKYLWSKHANNKKNEGKIVLKYIRLDIIVVVRR